MNDPQPYLVPDYYPNFQCKMGECRRPCCEGWPVSITMKDYFTLLSVDCSPALRRRLDTALHLAPHPTEEAYAQITPNYEGQCPLHLPDGRCGLQAELGAGVLAAVCQLYPRGVRPGEHPECSCACSCEAVPELLLNHPEPLQFVSLPLAFNMLPRQPRHAFRTGGREQEIRLWLIAHIQRRDMPLHQRLLLLGQAMLAMEQALAHADDAQVERLLSNQEALPPPPCCQADKVQLTAGLSAAERLLSLMDASSISIRAYGEEVMALFAQPDFALYQQAAAQLEQLIPQWETWLEHLLVNHMFFAQFPFQDRPVEPLDEYLSLCAVYVLLRFLLVGHAWLHPSREHLVDVVAAAFRLIDHTEFDRYAAPVLKQLGCDNQEKLSWLMCL